MSHQITQISPNNPLRDFPYWGHPDGKNVTLIDTLEWQIAYLEKMQTELPCGENETCLWHLRWVKGIQEHRIRLRKQQGVYGTNRPHKWIPEDGPPDDVA